MVSFMPAFLDRLQLDVRDEIRVGSMHFAVRIEATRRNKVDVNVVARMIVPKFKSTKGLSAVS